MTDEHDPSCAWERGGRPCRRFSTDGTALGAEIAHTMGTTDEAQIVRDSLGKPTFKSDVEDEQSDWEEWDCDVCGYSNSGPVCTHCALSVPQAHEPPPYPAASLEWSEPRLPGTTQA